MRRFLHILIYIGLLCMSLPAMGGGNGGKFVVVLDAGHGGKDPGTIGSHASHREKDIALNITLEVGRLLNNSQKDVQVVYTRSTDVFIELGRRAEIANKVKADLFVSIHVNALPKEAKHYAYGVQSYTLSQTRIGTNLEVEKRENSVIALEGEAAKKYNYNASPESNIMFELMQDYDMKESVAFAKLAQNEMVRTGGRKDMGVRQADLAVLRLTYMPSALLEVGYISTPAEEQFLLSKDGQKLMARSIYNAIAAYVAQRTGKSFKPTPAPTPSTTAQPENKPVEPTVAQATQEKAPAKEKRTVYKIQVLSGNVKLKENDRQFKGLICEMHQNGSRYTYTYGSATTMDEAKQLRKSILDKFPEAFIVSFEE